MSPRPGDESQKLGNHYEGAWIAWQLLEVLAGRAESVTIGELGEIGKGVELTLRRPLLTEVHQVKRQRGTANAWSLGDLRSEGVLESARHHVAAGREFHFVSTIPAQALQDLAERARHSPDLQAFVNTLPKSNKTFDYLSSTVFNSAHIAWQTLRGTWADWPTERWLRCANAALAGALITGAPGPAAAVTLADLAIEKMSEPLDRQAIAQHLPEYELQLAATGVTGSLAQAMESMHTSWKASVQRELLRPLISRAEVEQIVEQLADGERFVFAVGAGGAGKSAVLADVVERTESKGWVVLALRLDREEPFSNTYDLGCRFGLETSPVSALARSAPTRPSLLVVDQLDAVSKASGRMPQSFDAVADLVREASAFPDMHVLLACRKFDADNDDRIRTLIHDQDTEQIEVPELSDEQVAQAIQTMGIAPGQLTQQQIAILRLPLHLKLLSTIADQAENFSFTTTRELFDAYWDRKRRDCAARKGSSVRFADVIAALADEMSVRQRLSVSITALDERDLSNDADILASEHVLVRDGQQLRFFHETFFDYAFARRWTRRGQSLVQFLLEGEQELFRRSQVRQILSYIREENSERFVAEIEGLLLEPLVRFHIKHVALDFLKDMKAPTTAEWNMVERLLTHQVPFADRLWNAIRTVSWFDRLATECVFDNWLRADDEQLQNRALEVLLGGVKERPDQIATLLAPFAGKSARYPAWLRWVTRFADIDQSRKLFELMLEAITRGEYAGLEAALFMPVYTLGNRQPEWGVELVIAYLVDQPGAMALDESGRIPTLLTREYGAIELVTTAAAGAPKAFSLQLVPYMLRVMQLTSDDRDEWPINSRHFAGYSVRRDREPPYRDMQEALIVAAVGALRNFVQQQPDVARPLLEQLAADRHEAAQWLLYETLAAAPASVADYAAQLLLDRENGLYAAESWTVRRLIQAISPYLPAETFARLERAVIEFSPNWEGRPPGYGSFTLLSAMTEIRLSTAGLRRLGELRRLFGVDEPTEPHATGGFLGSPIPQEAASLMTDEQWLRAIAKHHADREDWTTFQGGARELSSVLKEEVKESPARFARLALKLGSDVHSAYTEAILMGLAESDLPIDPDLVFQCMRHIASLGREENDRWLAWPLQKHLKTEIPNDIIELLVDRAIHSKDPAGDPSSESFDDESLQRDKLITQGINTVRGQLVQRLGDILVHDPDGSRTAMVVPALDQLVSDPSIAVRACAAHLVAACLRHARPQALAALQRLIQADDLLLASRHTENLIANIANGDTAEAEPIIRRMLSSDQARVREAGGRLAAYVGLEFESTELFSAIRTSEDSAVRKGVAYMCVRRLPYTANVPAARELVHRSANDADEEVRQEVASLPVALRGRNLRPFSQELAAVIASPAFPAVVTQLLITLEQAPDRVDDLIIKCAQRFLELSGGEVSDISTSAASEARELGELILRAYAQAADVTSRAAALDLIDSLLASGAYGMSELVDATDR